MWHVCSLISNLFLFIFFPHILGIEDCWSDICRMPLCLSAVLGGVLRFDEDYTLGRKTQMCSLQCISSGAHAESI